MLLSQINVAAALPFLHGFARDWVRSGANIFAFQTVPCTTGQSQVRACRLGLCGRGGVRE